MHTHLQVGTDELKAVGGCVAPVIKILIKATANDHAEAEEGARAVHARQQPGDAARSLATRVVDFKVKALQQTHALLEERVPLDLLHVFRSQGGARGQGAG